MKTPIDLMLDGVTWVPVERQATGDSDLPYATHEGVLELFGSKLRCYRLNIGDAVFNADDFEAFWNAALEGDEE